MHSGSLDKRLEGEPTQSVYFVLYFIRTYGHEPSTKRQISGQRILTNGRITCAIIED